MDAVPIIHMISVTTNYAVIINYPIAVDIFAMPTVNFHPLDAMVNLDEPTRIYLVDLR